MRNKEIDIQAKIKVIPFSVSRRTVGNDMKIDSYFPTFKLNDQLNDVFLNHKTKKYLKSGEETDIGILFKFPSLQIGRLKVNDEFELTEGPRTTIKGRIDKIVNSFMDKAIWERNLSKSMEELEKDVWVEPNEYESYLIERCHKLRKIPLSQLSNEQLRLAISQEMGIKTIMPIVIKKLIRDKFIECDFYPGDLLLATFRKLSADWGYSNFLKDDITTMIRNQFKEIKTNDEIPEKVKREIFEEMVRYENTDEQ